MRLALKIIGSKERHEFIGTFDRHGIRRVGKNYIKTILLKHIRDNDGKYLCDHLWFNETKGFKSLKLHKGDVLFFRGRIQPYVKGNGIDTSSYELDYKIAFPRQAKILRRSRGMRTCKPLKRKKVVYRYSHHFKKNK